MKRRSGAGAFPYGAPRNPSFDGAFEEDIIESIMELEVNLNVSRGAFRGEEASRERSCGVKESA
jgi:hypothetical protein